MEEIKSYKELREYNIYFVSAWSGGKDSTFMVDEILRRGEPLDEVIFCDTGYEFPIMYIYIEQMEKYWKSKYPHLKITKLNWGKGKDIWKKWAEAPFKKGQYEGQPRGFPFHMGMSWCTRELKINVLQRYVKKTYGKKATVYEYVGIAVDEPSRIRETGELYPLFDWGFTEKDCALGLLERQLHNPLYNHFHRTGCFNCPKQSLESLYKLWTHYPNEWDEIIKMYEHYNEIGAGVNTFKGYTIEALVEKFKKYESKGKPTNYLDEEYPIGCMCK